MKIGLHRLCMMGLLLLLLSCEDEYHYPSVSLEFVTMLSDGEGRMNTLIPDKGDALPVLEDRTGSVITPLSSRRLLCNYEQTAQGARIYSLESLLTPIPKPVDDETYEDGIKTDPVEMGSIWMGRNFLNMILHLKVGMGTRHTFGMVEDLSELKDKRIVTLLLYHDAAGDTEFYNRKVYLSVPLLKYVNPLRHDKTLKIKFKYYTYDEEGHVVLSEKYCEPGFDFTPESIDLLK